MPEQQIAVRTVDAEAFKGTVFFRMKICKPGVRAKVRMGPALQEYIDVLNAKDGEQVLDRAIDGMTVGDKSALGVTKRLFIPLPPTKESGVQIINDPYERACRFLSEVKGTLTGRFGKAQPSKIMDGLFVLPETAVAEYREEVNAAKARLEMEYLPAIETDYEAAIERAQTTPVKRGGLGPLFSRGDYAPVGDFLAAFQIDCLWLKLGVPEGLPEALRAEFSEELHGRFAQAEEEIFTTLRTQFAELIEHAADILTPGEDGKPKKFQASTLENIGQFIAVFQDRNIFCDDQLQAVVEQARALMTGVSAEKIRKDGSVREEAARRFGEIRQQLDGLVTIQAGRKFRLAETD